MRSGQGLLGQSEELDELMAKIIGDKIKEGRGVKIQDDMIIGGATQLEAAQNYIRILEKLSHKSKSRTEQNRYLSQVSRYLRMDLGERRLYQSISTSPKLTSKYKGERYQNHQRYEKLHRTV